MRSIDLVIPMVFPSDPVWQAAYNKAMGGGGAERNVRYRSWQTEELLVRCCLKFMPWLRCIHILLASESQAGYLAYKANEANEPNGANGDNGDNGDNGPQVKLVFHDQFIPAQYLPCFNVNTIEMWLHRIPDLSEWFIYSNDDLFPLSPLEEDDFFHPRGEAPGTPAGANGQWSTPKGSRAGSENEVAMVNGQCLLPCQHMSEQAYPASPNIFQRFVKNGLDMVAADWGAKFRNTWLRTGHSMTPMLRSTVEHVCARHADRILQSFTLKREPKNFNQYIFPFWQHLSGQYFDHVPPRRYVGPKNDTRDVAAILRDPSAGVVCLNDNEGIRDWETRAAIVRREIERKLTIDH